MGLDNGIILKLANRKIPKDFPESEAWWIDKAEDVAKDGEMHVAYWRKCWGIRGDILSILHAGQEGGEYPVEAEDLPAIRRALIKYLRPDYWEEKADSIWEFEEMIEPMLNILLNLKWLEGYLKSHPKDSAFFYDSY